jgi:hypothetical protein
MRETLVGARVDVAARRMTSFQGKGGRRPRVPFCGGVVAVYASSSLPLLRPCSKRRRRNEFLWRTGKYARSRLPIFTAALVKSTAHKANAVITDVRRQSEFITISPRQMAG